MGINVAWVDERRAPLKEVLDPGAILSRLATRDWAALTDSKCLQFIEPWGDTTFNQTQIPVLLSELRVQVPRVGDPRESTHLLQVIELVEASIDQVHTYIEFTGD